MSTTETTHTITLTDSAAAKVGELIAQEGNPELALRVAVRPGGCSGFSYEMFFDSDIADDDLMSSFGDGRRSSSTRPAPACCRAPPSTSRMACRAPGSASTTPTPAAPAAAGSPSASRGPTGSGPRGCWRSRTHVASSRDLTLQVDGREVEVAEDGASLLEVLRDRLGLRSVKDGCSPQGQCGCCTVLVDGAPRVACVTPVRRVAGRSRHDRRGTGPEPSGPVGRRLRRHRRQSVRVLHARDHRPPGRRRGRRPRLGGPGRAGALLAHLCRCTGWRSVLEAAVHLPAADPAPRPGRRRPAGDPRRRHDPARRSRRRPRAGRIRRRPRPGRRPRGGERRARGMGRRRDAERGPPGRPDGPGPSQRKPHRPSARGSPRAVGRHPSDHLGRARLPRARRLLVPARW